MKYKTDKKINSLKIYPTGYYLHYRMNGKTRTLKLGKLDITIATARNLAQKKLALVVDGIDPMETKIGETYNDLWQLKRKQLQNKGCKTLYDYDLIHDRYIKPKFGNKIAKSITGDELISYHEDITYSGKPYQANRIIENIRAVFNYAIKKRKVSSNPAFMFDFNPEVKRKRYLTANELVNVVKVLNIKSQNTEYPNSIKFIWLLILTGARKGELAKAKWSDLYGDKIVLQDHKTKDKNLEPRVIHLSKQALNIVNSIERTGESILGIKSPDKMWRSVRKEAGCEDVKVHDLRHTYASYARKTLTKLDEVGNLLGHTDMQSTQRYAHIFEEDAKNNAQKVGDYIQDKYMRGN